jgi:hypothetical protein
MESEDRYRGIAPVVLTVVLLLLALVPVQALAQGDVGDFTPLNTSMVGGPSTVSDEQTDPVDIPDIKETIPGKLPGEAFGGQVAGLGDVDNDGYDDFSVLVPTRGYAVIYHGGPQIREAFLHPLAGTEFPLSSQSQVRPAGDIDFDGFDDALITAPDVYISGMRAAGAVFVFYGSPSGLKEVADQVIVGTEKDMRMGSDVDSVGDINKDGYSDIIVGADGWNDETGLVRLYLGGPDGLQDHPVWTWEGEATGDRFGHAVTGAGDLNADGWPDFAVGAPFATSGQGKGRVYIYYGEADLSQMGVGSTIFGRMLKSYFGLSIRLAGDVNNDGFSDLIISAPEDPSGPGLKAGKVELYVGEEHGINTTPKWTLQGESSDALLGFTIAFLGDVNRDGYDDVAIGAPSHTSEGVEERGKFYIYFGDKTGFRNAPSVVELGDEAGDRLSMGLAGAGDIDGDGFRDVLVGAPGADTPGGIDSGELHLYRGSDLTMPPFMGDAFSILDPTEGDMILVEHRRYLYRMSVTHRTGFGAINHVDLHLDPEGEDVVFRFLADTHNLIETSDEDDLADGIFVRVDDNSRYIDTSDVILDIRLHWGFPSGRPLTVRVEATDNHGLRTTNVWSDTARVVDRLEFSEEITITGDHQGELRSGDWVSASEGLSFTGALVEYDLAAYGVDTDITYYPPDNSLKVFVRDDMGGEWSAPVLKGAPISVHAIAPGDTRPEMMYSLSVESLDRSKVFRTVNFILNVDGTGVTFRNPDPITTISSLNYIASIEIEDPLGPGVDWTTVQYELVTAGDLAGFKDDWRDASSVTVRSDGSVVADADELFTVGKNHLIWRAKDLVGNGYTMSRPYEIEVDLGNIIFSNPLPIEGKWHQTGAVTVGITIENSRGIAINLEDIQYRTANVTGDYTKWKVLDASGQAGADPSRVNIIIHERFDGGDDNFIQWQARAVESGEYYTSTPHRVNVDLTGPFFSAVSPSDAVFVSGRDVTVTVTVEDALSGTLESSIMYQVLGEDIWHEPLSKSHRGDTFECTARVTLDEGVDNYVVWQARDAVGHRSGAFYQHIKVDTTAPTFSDFTPVQGIVVEERYVEVSIRVSDSGELGRVSGVDLRTLQYTIARPQSGQTAWTHPDIDLSKPIVMFQTVRFVIEVEEGVNTILWRVADASTPVVKVAQSEPYTILADLPDIGPVKAPIIIISEPKELRVDYGNTIFFDASGSYDEDGERLSFVWTSNIDDRIGSSASFSTRLSEGLHTITVKVTKEDSGISAEKTFYLSVESPDDTNKPFSSFWEQMALVLILVFVLITMLLQRWRIKEWDI